MAANCTATYDAYQRAFHEDYPLAEVRGWAAYFQKSVDMNQFVETVATILKVPRDPGLFS